VGNPARSFVNVTLIDAGNDLLSLTPSHAVPSAQRGDRSIHPIAEDATRVGIRRGATDRGHSEPSIRFGFG